MFPGEIESDLLLRGIDIHDWFTQAKDRHGRLKLSSRRLLTLLEFLPDKSAFKTSAREDWSDEEYVQVGILNEIRMLRGDQAAIAGHEMDPVLLESPRQLREREEYREEQKLVRDGLLKHLRGEVAFNPAAAPVEIIVDDGTYEHKGRQDMAN